MVYKRSKTLYLGFLAGIALVAGITHSQPANRELTVVVGADETNYNSSQFFVVSETAHPQLTTDQNHEINQTNTHRLTLLD